MLCDTTASMKFHAAAIANRCRRWFAAALALAAACLAGAIAFPASAAPVDLGSAAGFTVLGLPGTHINNSLVTITGNEGIAADGTLTNMAPSTVTGNVYQAAAGQYSGPGSIGGSLLTDPTFLAQAVADALIASSAAKGLSPTQTLSTVSTPLTLTGNGGVNVIDITGDLKNSLTLTGSAADYFIVNVSGTLTFGGNAALALAGGVTADHVLYNFTGAGGGTITSHVGNTFYGTLLAPDYSFNLDGSFHGRIIGGGSGDALAMLSGATVANTNTTVVPEPSAAVLAAVVLGALGCRRRTRRAA